MTTPYRTDLDALRETKEALEKELSATKARESQLAGELRNVEERIRTKTRLPMLDSVRVASPCNASWDEMLGDDRVRFCTSCEKNVFNLSAMPREDAERLLVERMGGELCVRFFQRADGTIMTQDCPVGVTKKRRKLAVLAAAGAGAMALAAVSAMTRTMGERCTTMGEMTAVDEPQVAPQVMGTAAPPAYTTPPVQANPTPHVEVKGDVGPRPHLMGAVSPRMGKPVAPPPPPHSQPSMGRR